MPKALKNPNKKIARVLVKSPCKYNWDLGDVVFDKREKGYPRFKKDKEDRSIN